MEHLRGGQNFGKNRMTLQLSDLILTEQFYNPKTNVPWHYHENAYLAYHLGGSVKEVTKKKSYICVPSTILYHNWQDPHCNAELSPDLHIFHIELKPEWFERHDVPSEKIEGSFRLENPVYQSLLRKLYTESKICDDATVLAVDGLLLQVMAQILRKPDTKNGEIPVWVSRVKEILNSHVENLSLNFLSNETQVHPVQLSRDFSKYFGCSFGEYIRSARLEKATALLARRSKMLTEIAFECGFSDQSHFIRTFKQKFGITPNHYRNKILRTGSK